MKPLKTLALVACLAALSLMLCSCNYLDEIKLTRAQEIDDSTIQVLGHTYTLVGGEPYRYGGIEGYNTIWFAEDDVPLLLTSQFGYTAATSWDGKIFAHEGKIYAREDVTEAERAALKDLKLDRFCFGFYYGGYYGQVGTWRLLSDSLTAAIKDMMAGTAFAGMPSESEESGVAGKEFYTSEYFSACDANVYFLDGEYCFSIYEDGSMFLMDWNKDCFYQVPEKYKPLVKEYADTSYEKSAPIMVEGY